MFAGTTGSGKSYAIGAAYEELVRKGIRNILLDTKTTNHIGLIQIPEVNLVKISPKYEFNDLSQLLEYPYVICVPASRNIPISDIIDKYREIVSYLWMNDSNRVIIAEEAHNWNKNASVPDPLFEQIAREGRGNGIFAWFVTQRLQNFSQLLWSQCSYTYLWHFNIPSDIRYAGQMVPDFERINREELETHDMLIWDSHKYEVVKANEITRKTQHKG